MDPPKQEPAVSLEAELTCSICADLLYRPLTLLDCLHTFCGACVKEWFSWQAVRAESAPGPPPPPSSPVFTCPSCREPVRDTKHDARVATLLDMFLALHPDKVKTAADRAEMDAKYRKGDKVLPRLSFADRTPEQRRLDEEERRLLAQVQQMSLREAVAEAAAANERGSRGQQQGGRRRRAEHESSLGGAASSRRSQERSRGGDGAQGGRTGRGYGSGSGSGSGGEADGGSGGGGGGRRRAQSATLRAENRHGGEEGPRRRSESRQRVPDESATEQHRRERQRQVEHQSSLRSLINTDGIDSRDLEREIEDFARQIQEEGLLDGLDLDNIDLNNNDELSRKITEAYRRRHRERLRQDQHGGRRSNASSRSHRSDLSATRPRSRTDDASRPASRHSGGHSRPPSASSNEERGRYPPSASHLEVQEPSRRRRTPSGTRSATVPIGPAQPEIRIGTPRSQSDLSARASSAEHHPVRPAMASVTGGRSTSSPTTTSAPAPAHGSPDLRGLPFSARAASGLGISQPQPQHESSSDQTTNPSRKRPLRPSELVLGSTTTTTTSHFSPTTSGPLSTTLGSPAAVPPPLASPRGPRPPLYPEPFVTCMRCKKEHIEYDLHYNCSTCDNGDWNICLDCWRRGKGCMHWFGFGYAAWARWEKRRAVEPNAALPPPHMLRASRYLPPKQIPGGAEGRRTLTTDNPVHRLQSGTFCCNCTAWTNDCYWRCETCNEGDWGFCNDCVNQGKSCTHALLPLSYQPSSPTPTPTRSEATPPSSPHTHSRSSSKGGSSPGRSPVRHPVPPPLPPGSSILARPNSASMGDFRPLTFSPSCELCKRAIAPQEPRYHCNSCPPKLPKASQGGQELKLGLGEYNLCQGCYAGLVSAGKLAAENGPDGWRRCPAAGHRMVVVRFVVDERGGERRVVVRDYVGGRRLGFEPYHGGEGGMQVCWWWRYVYLPPSEDGSGAAEGGSGDGRWVKKRMERLVALNVAHSSSIPLGTEGRWTDAFPPDGGEAPRGRAGWSWYPSSVKGAEDELVFPKGAEILEIEDVNGDWYHGFYMGARGLVPAPYVKFSATEGDDAWKVGAVEEGC